MSFRRYPEYNASNIEWFEEYPSHWTFCRADAFITSNYETIAPERMQGATVFHYSIPVVQETGDGQYEDGETIDSSKFRVTEKQVLVSKLNPRKGTVCLAHPQTELTVCSGEFIPLTAEHIDLEYLLYSVKSSNYRFRLESLVESATRSHKRAAPEDILKFHWAFPPKDEQTQIARFLDHQTARIDALIAEQQRLIELLKEKRQAVISHAVTKGLDLGAAMKDSGVEWLGGVPEHWTITRLKHYADLITGYPFPSSGFSEDECDIKLLRGANVGIQTLKWNNTVYWPLLEGDPLNQFLMREDQIVIGMDRPWIGDGLRIARVKERDLPCLLVQRVAAIDRTADELNTEFLYHLLSGDLLKAYIEPELTGVSVPHISPDQIMEFEISLPPLEEQVAIANYVSGEFQRLDSLLAQADRSSALLQERRSALISAAVTGKIDVRDWEPPVSETFPQSTASEEAPA